MGAFRTMSGRSIPSDGWRSITRRIDRCRPSPRLRGAKARPPPAGEESTTDGVGSSLASIGYCSATTRFSDIRWAR